MGVKVVEFGKRYWIYNGKGGEWLIKIVFCWFVCKLCFDLIFMRVDWGDRLEWESK